ncbi:hypothetical protein [Photorhabdus sp. SF281]|uniref:hypothetical protein n=1 Tax=Photorhabdus sp. SF281 TaxID=3459527 RepID=UPI004044B8A2
MNKKTLLLEMENAIKLMENEKINNNKGKLQAIIDLFERAKIRINNNNLKFNAIRGAARMYAEMYSDYMNPIPEYLYHVEKKMDKFLEENK